MNHPLRTSSALVQLQSSSTANISNSFHGEKSLDSGVAKRCAGAKAAEEDAEADDDADADAANEAVDGIAWEADEADGGGEAATTGALIGATAATTFPSDFSFCIDIFPANSAMEKQPVVYDSHRICQKP